MPCCFQAGAQKIMYSEPDKDDTRRMVFEIMGKINNHYLIYKNTRANRHIVSVLDNEMKEVASVEQDYIPGGDRMINIDFSLIRIFVISFISIKKRMWFIVWQPKWMAWATLPAIR